MNFATIGSLLLAHGPAPLPWLYLVNLTQIEPRKIFENSHWLCRFGSVDEAATLGASFILKQE